MPGIRKLASSGSPCAARGHGGRCPSTCAATSCTTNAPPCLRGEYLNVEPPGTGYSGCFQEHAAGGKPAVLVEDMNFPMHVHSAPSIVNVHLQQVQLNQKFTDLRGVHKLNAKPAFHPNPFFHGPLCLHDQGPKSVLLHYGFLRPEWQPIVGLGTPAVKHALKRRGICCAWPCAAERRPRHCLLHGD